ncbi:NADPH-dependent FMN reductase [Streptomyces sp. NPDC127172]|uniref:NADPH-dependent FMN reductase n=1 Tax=Streptomyces sp. NPDC127172 TaxID=3345382 RepID=UPI00364283F7
MEIELLKRVLQVRILPGAPMQWPRTDHGPGPLTSTQVGSLATAPRSEQRIHVNHGLVLGVQRIDGGRLAHTRRDSYPASLKAAIDWHFTQWTAKPVAFVSYGGAAGGGRHAVLHLENVLTELHAVTIRDGLAFPNYFTAWQDGRPLAPEAPGYAKTLLDQLAWWAAALRSARNAAPYPA